ncbi:alanine racemase [Homoserinibacter sp. GY 40078]|uniref:alanine racemase n=1 Tax=Homoserinibacter sp. GY 40078 TaxID=2603275 RepID=UPI0011C8124D|nr:alanine racemase [Homoserinibacter sp. GY 40078]TXK19471.1 alanine racemase [Homoserinibacter sp. GY 40078]
MTPHATLRIEKAAIEANTRTLVGSTQAEVMAVVKADGFGHGLAALSALEAGATRLGVTSIEEALPLRWMGVEAPILSWLNPLDADATAAIRNRIELAVPSIGHLGRYAAAASRCGGVARIHLHVDTGMARDGAAADEWRPLCDLAREYEARGLVEVVGIMSHLARADEPGHPLTVRQRLLFDAAVRTAVRRGLRPRVRHLAATAATLTDASTHFDLVRVGAGLYGIDPSGTTTLRGAMTLSSRVTTVREVRAATPVGYGSRYLTDRPTRLALVPLGYADGVPRGLSDGASAWVRGRRVPIAGAVSMDQLVIDVGELGVEAGEEVVLFGPGDDGEPTLHEWAGWAGTIEHELVTRIGSRVHVEEAA